jgi:multiple sugar transport system substrate-binding protein
MQQRKVGVSRRTILKGAAVLGIGSAAGLYAPHVMAQPKTLSLFVVGPDQPTVAFLEATLAEFKKQTGYDVELRQSDWGSAFQKLLTAAGSGTMADVSMMGQVMTPALTSKGAFLAIDDRLEAWADTDQYYAGLLEDGAYDGKHFAIPIYAATRTAVYRSDLLERVGVATDALPQTWDDFKGLANKLAKKNGGPLDAPFFPWQDKSVGLMQTYSQMLYQANGTFFDDKGKAHLSAPEGVRSLEYLVSFFTEGLANPNLVYQGSGPRPLAAGLAAMTYMNSAEVRNARQFAPEVEKFIHPGIPLTADAGGDPTTISWIDKFGIGANTSDPEGSWLLLSHLASREVSATLAQLYGGLPARQDQTGEAFVSDVPAGFVSCAQYARPLPKSANLLEIQQQLNVALQGAIRQSGTPAQVLAELDKKIDEINGV